MTASVDKDVLDLRRFKIEKLETKIECAATKKDLSYYSFITDDAGDYNESCIRGFIDELLGYLEDPYVKCSKEIVDWLRSYLFVNILGSIYYYENKAKTDGVKVSNKCFQLYSFIFNCSIDVCSDSQLDPDLPDNRICFETAVFSNFFHSTIFRFPDEKKLFMEEEYKEHYANVTRLKIDGSTIGYADDYTLPDHPVELRNKVRRMINCFCDKHGLSPYLSDDRYESMFIGLNMLLNRLS